MRLRGSVFHFLLSVTGIIHPNTMLCLHLRTVWRPQHLNEAQFGSKRHVWGRCLQPKMWPFPRIFLSLLISFFKQLLLLMFKYCWLGCAVTLLMQKNANTGPNYQTNERFLVSLFLVLFPTNKNATSPFPSMKKQCLNRIMLCRSYALMVSIDFILLRLRTEPAGEGDEIYWKTLCLDIFAHSDAVEQAEITKLM